MVRRLIRIALVLAIIIVIAGLVFVLNLDVIVRRKVEQAGTSSLGVPVQVDGADVAFGSGTLELTGFRAANPQGFDAPHFMRIERTQGQAGFADLRADPVVIPSVTLSGIDMQLQRRGTSTNYQPILDHMKRSESPEGKKYVIRTLTLRDINVGVELLPVGGESSRLNMPIDEIVLENIGSAGDNKAALGDIIDIVVEAILGAVVAGGLDLPGDLLADLGTMLEDLPGLETFGAVVTKGIGEPLEAVGEAAKGIGEELERATDDVRGVLENLGGGGREKE